MSQEIKAYAARAAKIFSKKGDKMQDHSGLVQNDTLERKAYMNNGRLPEGKMKDEKCKKCGGTGTIKENKETITICCKCEATRVQQ